MDDDEEARTKFESAAEDKFCEMLCERIMVNIEKRNAHQAMLDKNQQMIKDVTERFNYIKAQSKKILNDLGLIMKNAKFGIGSTFLLGEGFKGSKIFAGRLVQMQKDQQGDEKSNKGGLGKKKESKKSEQNKDLGQYF